jgi:hypothetical protein
VEVSGLSFFAAELFRVECGAHKPAGQFIKLLQKTIVCFLVPKNSNRQSLHVKLVYWRPTGFNLHVSRFSWMWM